MACEQIPVTPCSTIVKTKIDLASPAESDSTNVDFLHLRLFCVKQFIQNNSEAFENLSTLEVMWESIEISLSTMGSKAEQGTAQYSLLCDGVGDKLFQLENTVVEAQINSVPPYEVWLRSQAFMVHMLGNTIAAAMMFDVVDESPANSDALKMINEVKTELMLIYIDKINKLLCPEDRMENALILESFRAKLLCVAASIEIQPLLCCKLRQFSHCLSTLTSKLTVSERCSVDGNDPTLTSSLSKSKYAETESNKSKYLHPDQLPTYIEWQASLKERMFRMADRFRRFSPFSIENPLRDWKMFEMLSVFDLSISYTITLLFIHFRINRLKETPKEGRSNAVAPKESPQLPQLCKDSNLSRTNKAKVPIEDIVKLIGHVHDKVRAITKSISTVQQTEECILKIHTHKESDYAQCSLVTKAEETKLLLALFLEAGGVPHSSEQHYLSDTLGFIDEQPSLICEILRENMLQILTLYLTLVPRRIVKNLRNVKLEIDRWNTMNRQFSCIEGHSRMLREISGITVNLSQNNLLGVCCEVVTDAEKYLRECYQLSVTPQDWRNYNRTLHKVYGRLNLMQNAYRKATNQKKTKKSSLSLNG